MWNCRAAARKMKCPSHMRKWHSVKTRPGKTMTGEVALMQRIGKGSLGLAVVKKKKVSGGLAAATMYDSSPTIIQNVISPKTIKEAQTEAVQDVGQLVELAIVTGLLEMLLISGTGVARVAAEVPYSAALPCAVNGTTIQKEREAEVAGRPRC